MSKYRYWISFLVTTLFYILLAVTLLYFQQNIYISDKKPAEKTIHLSLSAYAAPVTKEAKNRVKEKIPLQAETPNSPVVKNIIKPTLATLPKKEAQKRQAVKPKQVKKKTSAKKKPQIRKVPKKKKVLKKQNVNRHGAGKIRKQQSLAKHRERFLSKIRETINQNKHYPAVAKRRRIQGSVRVQFTILSNGDIGNMKLSGAKFFYKSAKKAVKSAFPVSVKNISISLPKTVTITLHYRLK